MNNMAKNLILWVVIAGILLMVFSNVNQEPRVDVINYSDFNREVVSGRVGAVEIASNTVNGVRKDNTRFKTIIPSIGDVQLLDTLLQNNVEVNGREIEQQSIWIQLLMSVFPILIIIAVFFFFMRQMQGGGAGGKGGPMSFGKSKAKLIGDDQIKVTFADVAGVDEAKEDVQELVEFLKEPDKFQRLGGRI
ncbi:MAG: ATP-dependent metalloprotease, partial [SAR86 cluster bacterium]